MDEMLKLANTLAGKPRLDDDEDALYRALLTYLETHCRLALLTVKQQMQSEGVSDEDLRGYSQTNG